MIKTNPAKTFSFALGLAACGFVATQGYAAEAVKVAAPAVPMMSDAQIAQILKTANDGEIDAAKVAKKRARSTDVKSFAKKMIDQHEANEKMEKDMAKKQSISFDETDKSKALKSDAEQKVKALKDEKDVAFDRAYMNSQVDMHKMLLGDLDSTLIPGAKNAELKMYLQETREHVKAHLEEAQRIVAKLKM